MKRFPDFVKELTNHFVRSGFNEELSFISTVCLLSTLSPDFKVEALTYKVDSEELRLVDYPLNLYYVLSGEAGSGKSTVLDKMLDIYLRISPTTDNVISARSSSMGILKNIKDEWNYVLANGDDADWLLDPELKDGSINEALLKLWNRQYLEHLIQSKEFTPKKRTTFSIWIGVHGFANINKEQIQNGLARRLIVYTFNKKEKQLVYSEITLADIKKTKKKNLSDRISNGLAEQLRQFIKDFIKPNEVKDMNVYEEYRIYIINDRNEMYLREVIDRIERYLATKPKFLDQVIRTYPEILQRFVAVCSLWDGTMVVEEDGKLVNLGRSVPLDLLRKTDEILWKVMCNYYDDLEKAKLGKIDYRIEDLSETIDDLIEFSQRSGMTSGKNFVCPLWKIKRNYSIDVEKLKKILETGVSTEKLKMFLGVSSNGKKGYFVCSDETEKIKMICIKNKIEIRKYVNYNLIESLVI